MVEIEGKTYKLIELSARRYQQLMDDLQKKYGDSWQAKSSGSNITIGVTMLTACLQTEDGISPNEDAIWGLTIKVVNKLSKDAMILNGLTEEDQEKLTKN